MESSWNLIFFDSFFSSFCSCFLSQQRDVLIHTQSMYNMFRHQRVFSSLLPLGGVFALGCVSIDKKQQQQTSLAFCSAPPCAHPTLTCQIERQNGRTVVFRDKQNFLKKRAAFMQG
jgi:hypothetical protein